MKTSILIVDDDRLSLEMCVDMLAELDVNMYLASTGAEACELIAEKDLDVLIVDLVLPDMSGEELIHRAKKKDSRVDVIVITGFATVESVLKVMKLGAFDYLKKPLAADDFKSSFIKCLREREIIAENKKLKEYLTLYDLGKMLTSTLEMPKIMDTILVVFEKFLNGSSIVVFGRDAAGQDFEVRAFERFDRRQATAFKDGFIAFAKGDVRAVSRSLGTNIYLVNTSDVAAFDEVGRRLCIFIPLVVAGEVRGYVFAFHDELPDEKREAMRFLADQMNLAIENSVRYLHAQEMAYVDELTKVFNSRYLYVLLDNELKRAERFSSNVSVLFIDVDYFKNVNDTYGHLTGSRLLIEVAGEIKGAVRSIDTVVRYGGDEFIVICTETDTELAVKVAERIRTRIEAKQFLEGSATPVRITVSIGVATFPVHARSKTEIIDLADKAMYRSKNSNRNMVCVTDRNQQT